ncbi:MAG: tRNA dihydrouridine synthase DusB [Gammaproteobacteria bacterium]|nr:tRNA dihydrouridine synthase DusB [Gammaproteobacteria bacterium]
MQIGPYHIDSKVILAPMAGVTDRPFRQLCKRLGAGMAISEMVSSNALLWKSDKTLRRIDHEGEPGPISVQIAGADPQQMAEAARFNVAHGAQIIDINMGCPAKKVCNVQAGSALLQNEALVDEITRSIVEAVDVPVTLKIRTGWDRSNRNAINIARIAEANGIQALAIHGRTRADAYRGEAEYETIQAVKQNITIPVIANGDISSPQKAKFVLDTTGADAIMIGRAAQGNPWVFREVNHYLETGTEMEKPSLEEVRSTLLEHLYNLYEFYGEYSGVRVARKHISWYSKGQRHGGAFRQAVNLVESSAEQIQMIKIFFDELSAKEGLAA